MASNIEDLHSRFASLDSKLRDEFENLVEKDQLKLKDIARKAATYLRILVTSLKFTDVNELFDSLEPFYDFFNCGVLKHLTKIYQLTIQSELIQYIKDVDKFFESSQLKNIQSAIKEKLLHLRIYIALIDQSDCFIWSALYYLATPRAP